MGVCSATCPVLEDHMPPYGQQMPPYGTQKTRVCSAMGGRMVMHGDAHGRAWLPGWASMGGLLGHQPWGHAGAGVGSFVTYASTMGSLGAPLCDEDETRAT
jgi:hypothetical protein